MFARQLSLSARQLVRGHLTLQIIGKPQPIYTPNHPILRYKVVAAMPRTATTRQAIKKEESTGLKPPSIKRKASSDSKEPDVKPPPSPARKKVKVEDATDRKDVPVEEQYGIVDRRFYPPLMSTERAKDYMNGKLPKPIQVLEKALKETQAERKKIQVKDAVVHFFKCDLRIHDNHSLHLASEKAKSKGVPLIGVYLVSPEDFEAHLTSPIRVDFIMRNLQVLKDDLGKLDIPLWTEIIPARKDVVSGLLGLCEKWGAAHIFANMEYEGDELRREAKLVRQGLKRGIDVTAVHDTCVVPPGSLKSGSGNQFSVYSPWYRSWMKHIHANEDLLEIFPPPGKNPASARKAPFKGIFESEIPDASKEKALESKRLETDQLERYRSYWPAGEHEAQDRLKKFLNDRIAKYADNRNLPAGNSTALLSCHFAAGTLSARTAVRAARDHNSSDKLDGGSKGVIGWISEVAWRDFYKHVMVHWPYIVFGVPFKPEYNDINWDYDIEKFDKWSQGQTGFPIVDAAIRQMHHMGYMHNRCRMIAASFLCKDLLQDWRMGEKYFMTHLIDGDFASNNGGWGFSSSAGVDPQPYFRIFNPLLQSEKFDTDGSYIRKWVPELKDVKGNAIHDPYGRGAGKIAEANGYPKPMVVHKEARDKALKMYKDGLGRSTT